MIDVRVLMSHVNVRGIFVTQMMYVELSDFTTNSKPIVKISRIEHQWKAIRNTQVGKNGHESRIEK
jgi:hypothetical protein